MISFNRKLSTKIKLIFSLVSALLLSCGWIGAGGLPLFVAFVPLMLISAQYSPSWRDTFRMLGWAALSFVLWNLATVWWVWNAAPIGTIAATVISSWWNLLAFMAFHIVSKYAPKGLAYVLFIAGWIATEYIYINAPALSFPWLVMGNGFSDDTWAVQWYEYTGVLGGSLWVLTVNVLALQALLTLRKRVWTAATLALVAPMAVSLVMYGINSPEGKRYLSREKVCVAAIQPNVDCYDKFGMSPLRLQEDIYAMLLEVPDSASFVLLPETSLATMLDDRNPKSSPVVHHLARILEQRMPSSMVVAGCESMRRYGAAKGSETARLSNGIYSDIYNSSIGVDSAANVQMHHKAKLVVGVETIPAWLRDTELVTVDLGGTAGQLGIGVSAVPFEHRGVKVAPAICYEGLYGDFMGGYVRNGAQALFVVTNDGWWGNTPGHRFLFAFCRLRAIELRRDVARSANTGVSGFINSRGDDISRMEWDERGILVSDIRLNDRVTLYARLGDYIGRIAVYVSLLCLLYFVAYRARKRFHLAD